MDKQVTVYVDNYSISNDTTECVECTTEPVNTANIIRQYGTLSMPYECEYKHRVPDPQRCKVLNINFEERTLTVTNGAVRLYPSFEEVNLYKFVAYHEGKAFFDLVKF